MEKTASSYKGLFYGLAAGGAIGVVAGLMFAPKPGKELRSDIKKKRDEIYEDSRQMISEVQTKTKSALGDAKHRVEEAKKDAMARLSEAHVKACEVLNCAGERASTSTEELA